MQTHSARPRGGGGVNDAGAAREPLFILASPRSFTSLVCAMIGQHRCAYGLPEVNLMLADTLDEMLKISADSRQFLQHGILRTVAQLYGGEQTLQTIAMARRWLQRRRGRSCGEVYRELCHKVSPLLLVDKSPAYPRKTETMARIAREFPAARYLYLTRNPCDQGGSMIHAIEGLAELVASRSFDYASDPPAIDPQYEWYRTQARILNFLETIPEERQFHLRGEDFLQDARGRLGEICGWLGIDWSEEEYERLSHPEDSPYACMGPYGAQWGNNPGFQRSPAFRPAAGPALGLDRPLPWRKDDRRLLPEVLELGRDLGYA